MYYAEVLRPLAAAIAAGEAAATCLEELYQHPEDQQLLAGVQASFERILFFQFFPFPDIVALIDGSDPWPQVVAERWMTGREDDGHSAGAHLSGSCVTCRVHGAFMRHVFFEGGKSELKSVYVWYSFGAQG